MNNLDIFIKELLLQIGLSPEYLKWTAFGVYVTFLTVVAIFSYMLVHRILVVGIGRIVSKTSVKWDDDLFNDRLLSSMCHIVPPVLLVLLVPILLHEYPTILFVTDKALMIYIVVVSVRLVNVFLTSVYLASRHTETLKGHPLKGLLQMLKLITICIGVIIIISLLIDKNPLIILSGLGASAAILMLIFKDTIMGLVAGVQLTANDMLKPGDWISAPKHGVDGVVTDLTLTTVKIQNWDMTTVTIPPYSLVSEAFQNWRGMQDSGGRRVKRSINIDLNSIKFLTPDQIKAFSEKDWWKNLSKEEDDIVNLQAFRAYIEHYLRKHKGVHQNMTLLVRQLQPTNHGVPIELYFFTATTEWNRYEAIQAKIFEHMFAVAHSFGLRLFQSPSGLDLKDEDIDNE